MTDPSEQETLRESLAATIAGARGDLTPTQRRVADHLAQSGPAILVRSAADIARDLDVSDATVVRTAQALGFAGLPELRRALAVVGEEPTLSERLHRTLEQAEGSDLLATAVDGLLASLDVLVQHVPRETFDRAVAALAEAGTVLWSGIGPSAPLADYAGVLSRRIGRRSQPLTQSGLGAADDLLSVGPDSAVVVLAYGQVRPHVAALFDRAEELDVPIVLITDVLQGQLGARAAETLVTWRGTPGFFSASHAPTVVLIEALVLGIANADPDRAEATLAELNDLRLTVS